MDKEPPGCGGGRLFPTRESGLSSVGAGGAAPGGRLRGALLPQLGMQGGTGSPGQQGPGGLELHGQGRSRSQSRSEIPVDWGLPQSLPGAPPPARLACSTPPAEAWLGSGTGPWWAEWGKGQAQEGWGAGAQRAHVLPGFPSHSHHGPTLTGLPSREKPLPWALGPCRKGTWSQVGMVAGGSVLGVR